MSFRFRRALPGALVLLSVAAPAAVAVPTNVTLRVEGASKTIFDGQVVSDGHDLTTAAGGGPHPCDGTNNGAYPSPGATATAALDDAARANGFSWDGAWFDGFADFSVDRVADESATTSQFWGFIQNGEFAQTGGCQSRVNPGDEVVFAFDAFSKTSVLRLEGPGNAAIGQPVSVRVIDTAPDPAAPAAGATVNGVATGSDGLATLSFAQKGIYRLKADRPDAVRSGTLVLCVDPAGADPCSSTDTAGPALTAQTPAGQKGKLASSRGRSRTMLISWAGDDKGGSGVRYYSVGVAKAGEEAWRKLLDRSAANALHFRGDAGATYRFRITAFDRALNETSVETAPVVVPVDDRNRGLWRFSKKGWKRVKAENAWGSTVIRAGGAGATARFSFEGENIALVGRKLAKGGKLRVTLDGRDRTLDVRGRSGHRSLLWSRGGLADGRHRLVLRSLGGGPVELDAVAPSP